MKYFLLLIAAFALHKANAQIFATTSAGKKVVLYTDGTWKYQEQGDAEKPCHKFQTGNVTIKNNTDADIYFYYDGDGRKYVKVKAGTSKTATQLRAVDGLKQPIRYYWNASIELYENDIRVVYMKGIEKGEFVLTACETLEIEIDN